MRRPPLDPALDDHLVLKKPHPCGSNRWVVTRVGADIGLRCTGCGRQFMMARSELAQRVKAIEKGGDPTRA